MRETEENPEIERWAIMLKGEEGEELKMIGVVGIVRTQEIGYRINREYWGKGYMSEALNMFLEMWFGMPCTSLSFPIPLLMNWRKGK